MSLLLITAPTELPLTLAQIKQHLRDEETVDQDATIMSYLRSALSHIDGASGWVGRAIVEQTWEVTFDCFPKTWSGRIVIPLPPLRSITTIKYLDTAGVEQTLDSSKYRVLQAEHDVRSGIVEPAHGESWPATRDVGEAVTIRFVAGYGARNAVPAPIRTALMLHVEMLYDRDVQAQEMLKEQRDELLAGYRVWL